MMDRITVAGSAYALTLHESITHNDPASPQGQMLDNIMEGLSEYIENSETCYSVLRLLEENVADIPAVEENQVAYQPTASTIRSHQQL